MATMLAGFYRTMFQYAKAESLYGWALAIAEKVQGAEHPDTGRFLTNLAGLYELMGQYAIAERLYVRALAIAEKAAGAEHPSTGTSLNNLAGLYQKMGQYAKAEPLHVRALVIAEKAHGAGHPSTGTSLNHLAGLYRAMGQYAKAEPLYVRALAIAEKAYGAEHTSTGRSLNTLAGLYQSMGQYAKAEPLYVRALAITEKAYGAEDPSTLTSLNHLAGLYESMGQYAKAEPLYVRALAITEKAYGAEDPSNLTSLNHLAGLYGSMGQYAKAEPLRVRALAIAEKVEGPEHPNTGALLNNLAVLYETMGQYAKAEPLYVRALAMAEKAEAAGHPSTGASLNNLAGLYHSMGQYAKAEPLYVRALAIAEKAQGPEHPETGKRLNNLAVLYVSMGQYAKAEPLYVRALAIAEKAQGPEHPSTGTWLNNLAGLYYSMGQYAKAEPLYVRTLAIFEKVQGAEHPDTGTSLNNLAVLYESMGQYAKAEPLYVRALAIAEKAQGPEHPDTGIRLNNLAGLYYSMGQYAKVEPLYVRALAITEKAEGPEHPSTGTLLRNLAVFYGQMAQPAKAEPLYLRALAIAQTAESPRLRYDVQSALARFHHTQGRSPVAIFFGKQAVNTFQRLRGQAVGLDEASQRSLLEDNKKIYEELADWLVGDGRLAEAQQVLSMLKEQEYHDFIRRDSAADARVTSASYTGAERAWAERYAQVDGRVVALSRELQALASKVRMGAELSAAEQARRAELRGLLDGVRRDYDALVAQITREAIANAGRAEDQAAAAERALPHLRALQATLGKLGPGTVLIHTVSGKDRLTLILTTADAQLARQVAVPDRELNATIGQLRLALENPRLDPRPAAQKLYGWLVAPLRAELEAAKATTLMVSLDGALRYVPLAALHDGSAYLVQRYGIALYTEAARDKLQERPSVQDWSATGLGLTKAVAGFSELPSVEQELRAVIRSAASPQGALPGAVHLDTAFTANRLRDALELKQPVLHIASHFSFNPGTDADSFLVLGDGSKLTLADMRVMDFAVELLTLSACQTALSDGQSRSADGREVEGFAVLAQKRGAAAVLATLWSVADASTGEFMRQLYSLKVQQPQLSKAQALRQVQQAFIEGRVQVAPAKASQRGAKVVGVADAASTFAPDPRAPYAHPFYWAPFVLMGNWL